MTSKSAGTLMNNVIFYNGIAITTDEKTGYVDFECPGDSVMLLAPGSNIENMLVVPIPAKGSLICVYAKKGVSRFWMKVIEWIVAAPIKHIPRRPPHKDAAP